VEVNFIRNKWLVNLLSESDSFQWCVLIKNGGKSRVELVKIRRKSVGWRGEKRRGADVV
jgi:hypothetical protein